MTSYYYTIHQLNLANSESHELDHQITHMCYRRHRMLTHSATKSHELRHPMTGGCGADNDNDQHAAVRGWKGEWPNTEEQRLPGTLPTGAAAQASHCGNININTYAYGKHTSIHICIFAYMYMCERRQGRFGRRKIVSQTLFAGAAAQASDWYHTYTHMHMVNM